MVLAGETAVDDQGQWPVAITPAGYARLVERHGLRGIPNWHESFVAPTAVRREAAAPDGSVVETYGAAYWPGDSDYDHLEFALKYDGTNLALLAELFKVLEAEGLTQFIAAAPFGKYRRRLWYLFEWLTGRRLPLADMTSGNYVDLVPAEECFTSARRRLVGRQRVNDNLLGDRSFSPTIRRTAALKTFAAAPLSERCTSLIADCAPDVLQRALSYLYTKETKSSFAIEREEPTPDRTTRFVDLLARAQRENWCEKPRLLALQHAIVDPRFRENDYRTRQSYVGESVSFGQERVHYVCPKPEQVAALMAGLIVTDGRLRESDIHPVVHAAAVGYGFVFIHPFEDGNGRIHRFLIHNILAMRAFMPPGIMVPVSAAMLRDQRAYDASLEAFSRPLLDLVEYRLDEDGQMTVKGDWSAWYQYPDLTAQTEALFRFVEQTIERDLPEELDYLRGYDRTKRLMQGVVDLPDRKLDLFIRLSHQNGGKLSAAKREGLFAMLTDEEVARLEDAVREGFRAGRDR
jgi:hypothetical protein